MLELPQVTLIALTSKDYEGHKQALDKASEKIKWGDRKIIMDYSITSIDEWNRKIVYELHNYVQTPFCFLFHADGYPNNPECWREGWLQYDYCGSPWPLPKDSYSYRTSSGRLVRVGNSVGLRSLKLMKLIAGTPEAYFWSFKEKYGNTNEDGYISCHNREFLEKNGCKFMPFEEAVYFSKEHSIEENKNIEKTFAFHQVDL